MLALTELAQWCMAATHTNAFATLTFFGKFCSESFRKILFSKCSEEVCKLNATECMEHCSKLDTELKKVCLNDSLHPQETFFTHTFSLTLRVSFEGEGTSN